MRAARKRTLAVDVTWMLVLTAVFAALLYRPYSDRTESEILKLQIDEKRALLDSCVDAATSIQELDQVEKRHVDWHNVTDSESLRIAALSRAAREAGVAIVSLRNWERQEAEKDTAIRVRSHSVEALGSYRQLARFLENVAVSRGAASVENLILEPDDPKTPDLLQASFTVSWYSYDPEASPLVGEEPPG